MMDGLSSLWFKWILFNKQSGVVIDCGMYVYVYVLLGCVESRRNTASDINWRICLD